MANRAIIMADQAVTASAGSFLKAMAHSRVTGNMAETKRNPEVQTLNETKTVHSAHDRSGGGNRCLLNPIKMTTAAKTNAAELIMFIRSISPARIRLEFMLRIGSQAALSTSGVDAADQSF